MPKVTGYTKVFEVTPTITAGAYSAGDQLGELQSITDAFRLERLPVIIQFISVVDSATQDAEIDFLFFDEEPTIASSDNAAFSITDAELKDKAVGTITVDEYKDFASNSIGTKVHGGLIIRGANQNSMPRDLWFVAIVRGTPTYGTTSDLVFRIGVFQD
jgi:hypothetical protein